MSLKYTLTSGMFLLAKNLSSLNIEKTRNTLQNNLDVTRCLVNLMAREVFTVSDFLMSSSSSIFLLVNVKSDVLNRGGSSSLSIDISFILSLQQYLNLNILYNYHNYNLHMGFWGFG